MQLEDGDNLKIFGWAVERDPAAEPLMSKDNILIIFT